MRARVVGVGVGALVLALALASWPAPVPEVVPPGPPTAFRWDARALFADLEGEFERLGALDVTAAASELDSLGTRGRALLAGIETARARPDAELAELYRLQLAVAVRGAAHPALMPRVLELVTDARVVVLRAASSWPGDRATHEALYRAVFGGRMALDEALVQAGADALPSLVRIEEVPSAAPSVLVEGVRIHSGDILLSRGGAPTSALIARGSDFPNTFSHAALVHVDGETGEGTVVESLIETGSVLTTASEYLARKSHRILVLRPRPDHPALLEDPLLPHRAAEAMLARVRAAHVPYDFAMEWSDGGRMFCSEVVHHAYAPLGVDLWPLRSSMSAPGLVRWLGAMGVEEFTSLVPSDLEYDPQLAAVVEWRNAPALMDFRLDNAIIDALLEEADHGADLGFAWYRLPLARGLKAYSVLRDATGGAPTIPEGMSAATALRVQALVSGVTPPLRSRVGALAQDFRTDRGYEAPYWVLVELAREALRDQRDSLAPALVGGG